MNNNPDAEFELDGDELKSIYYAIVTKLIVSEAIQFSEALKMFCLWETFSKAICSPKLAKQEIAFANKHPMCKGFLESFKAAVDEADMEIKRSCEDADDSGEKDIVELICDFIKSREKH